MRRTALIALVASALLGGAAPAYAQTAEPPPVTTPTPVPPPAAPPLAVTLDACQKGVSDTAVRSATFSASMPAIKRSARLWVRFDLYLRASSAKLFKRLAVPKWGVWQKSKPGVPGFIVSKRVDALVPGFSYRAYVQFRWYDKSGRILRTERRTSALCVQPDPRPDLSPGPAISGVALDATHARYTVAVRNRGLSAAGPFGVTLSVAGETLDPAPLAGLAAGAAESLTFDGPSCRAGTQITVSADPENTVDEASETDNVTVLRCPTLKTSP